MWPTREQALCLRDRTLAQLAAYACRRNDLAVLLDELAGHVRAAVREGPSLDVGRRTARPHPEAKIRPREDGAWSHDASQEVEEGIRRHREDLAARRQDERTALGPFRDHREALGVREQFAKRRVIGAEYLVGIALEGHGNERNAKLAGLLARLGENRPVPDVHAIEDADDEHGVTQSSGHGAHRVAAHDVTRPSQRR